MENDVTNAGEILTLIDEAVEQIPDDQAAGLGFARNFRINLKKAMEAAARGMLAGATLMKIWNGTVGPADFGGGAAAIGLWASFLDAIRDKLTPLQYAICVALSYKSKETDDSTLEQLKEQVKEFLRQCETKEIPWWLRLSKQDIADAKVTLSSPLEPHASINELKKLKLLTEDDKGRFSYASRNFTFGFSG